LTSDLYLSHTHTVQTSRRVAVKPQQKLPKLVVTGFGPFQGMDNNPTTELVNRLQQYPGLVSSRQE